ncbi:hypothetical protein AO265_30925 [Pseudomonas sp. ABAC61]|nr:hypothetical protein AO265_30925 [Pseudomonas sp. ABAC61]
MGEQLPDEQTADNAVRATFLRFLLLGGDESVAIHERGVLLKGAFITGTLNLIGTRVLPWLGLQRCRFEKELLLRDAILDRSFRLDTCELPGLNGARMIVNGSFFLCRSRLTGAVNISGAKIVGSLDCMGASLSVGMAAPERDVVKEEALLASYSEIAGNVHLTSGFNADSDVRFLGARIGGQVNCRGGNFCARKTLALSFDSTTIQGDVFLINGFSSKGRVSFIGAQIFGQMTFAGGNLDGDGDKALEMSRATVRGSVFFYKKFKIQGLIDLSNVCIDGSLTFQQGSVDRVRADNLEVKGALVLRKYFIDIQESMSIGARLNWLKKQKASLSQANNTEPSPPCFHPQPWRQLQQVLESMGHAEEARAVGIEHEQCLRDFDLIGQTPEGWHPWRRAVYRGIARVMHSCYGKLTGFGYRPMLLLQWFALVWASSTLVYWGAANLGGVFAPSDPLVFQNPEYETCRPDREALWYARQLVLPPLPAPADYQGEGNWYLCSLLREEYTGFSPMAFSLDLLLPLVDLHQENDWAPLIATPKANVFLELLDFFSLKRFVRFVMWCEIIAGWGFSLLFVAVVSGLARRKE